MKVILEIKRPVPVRELAAITDALIAIYGDGLRMMQSGPYLQIIQLDLPDVSESSE